MIIAEARRQQKAKANAHRSHNRHDEADEGARSLHRTDPDECLPGDDTDEEEELSNDEAASGAGQRRRKLGKGRGIDSDMDIFNEDTVSAVDYFHSDTNSNAGLW